MKAKMEEFFAFEKEEKLFSRTYLGIPYWTSLRIILARPVEFQMNTSLAKTRKFSDFLLAEGRLIRGFLHDIVRYMFLSKCDILYFDNDKYRIVDGEMVDINFDDFDFDKEYKIQRCYLKYNYKGRPSLKGVGTAIPGMIEHLLTLSLKMQIGNYRDEQEDRFLKQLAVNIEKKFHLGYTPERLIYAVRKIAVIHKAYGKFYERLLIKCNPRAVFVVCHYTGYLFPLYNIARGHSIPVIEIQHGRTSYHYSYWYGDTSKTGKQLPSYFFSYGAFWDNFVNLPEGMETVPIGNPFLEERKEKYKNCVQDEKMMVFYSSVVAEKEMEQLVIDAWKYFGKRGYKLFFKIHPNNYDTWREHYKLLVNYPEIQIVPPEMDLYELLSCAKHHITFASTVLFEAVIFDNNRYIYDIGIQSAAMEPLAELKLAYKFKTVEELDSLLNIPMGPASSGISEIWKEEAKRNGQIKLREIIENNGKICKA